MTRDEDHRRFVIENEDYNESFRGEVLNEEKMSKLNRMKKICGDIAKLEPKVEAPFVPFDCTNRNGVAAIVVPSLWMSDKSTVRSRLAFLFSEADSVIVSALSGDHIRITFTVMDMWDKFHHEGYEENE